MKDNLLYWLWLQECLGPNAKVKDLLGRYESPGAFYNAGEIFWNSENFTELVFDKLRSYIYDMICLEIFAGDNV